LKDDVILLAIAAGQLLDAVKRHVIYEKPLEVVKGAIMAQLAEVDWRIYRICEAYQIDTKTVLDANTAKLSKRYHSLTYKDAHAQERADKQ
jgi:hypothetical protein